MPANAHMIRNWRALVARVPLPGRPARPGRRHVPDLVLAAGTASLVLVVLGLLSVPAVHTLKLRAKEAAVVGNAATVQLAAESYAAAHRGRYAEDALDLLPYLPGDSAPLNPYTGSPITFRGAAGDLTYRSPTRGGDYIIQAWAMGPGQHPRLVRTFSGRSKP